MTDVFWSVTKGDWFTSVDLMDTYFHVPIAVHPRTFQYFSFRNQTDQFRVLSYGLSLAPRVFRCMKAALSALWSQGLRLLPYLDYWLFCAQTRDQDVYDTQLLLDQVGSLGEQGKELTVPHAIRHVHWGDDRFIHNPSISVSISDDRYSKYSCPVSSWDIFPV